MTSPDSPYPITARHPPTPQPVSEPDSPSTYPELSVTWAEYHHLIERLAVQVYQSGWQFNQLVCLSRGGLRIGDLLSRLYRQPLAILAASSYGGTNNQVRGSLTFARDLAMTTANLGNQVLVVDDLVDSGVTLERSLVWLKQHYGFYIENIKTGVLWYKASSQFIPDFYVQYLPDNPWIHQPFEVYEKLDLATLSQLHLQQEQQG